MVKQSLAASVALSALVLALPATAQTAPPPEPSASDIIVTAQFRAQNLQDTPIAITAVNADMLEARSQDNVVAIAAQAPNVTLKPGGGIFGPSLQAYIRGIGQYDNNLGYEPGVGLYVDDVYYSTLTGSVLDLLDLDRVEILRGPQGTLAGKNSIGGAIKLFTKKPQGDNSGFAQVTYGRYDRVEFRGAYDFALTDNLFVRISGAAHDSDGYVKRVDYECENPGSGIPSMVGTSGSCKLGTEGGKTFVGGRIALRWVGEKVEVNLSADYTKDSSEVIPNQLLGLPNGTGTSVPQASTIDGSPLVLDSRFITAGKYKTYSTYCNLLSPTGGYCLPNVAAVSPWGVSANILIDLSDDMKLNSITSYRGYDGAFTYDNDASPLVVSPGYNTLSQKQFTQELRLSGVVGDLLDYTVGGFLMDAKNNNGGKVDIAYASSALFPLFGHLIDDDVHNKSKAVFLQTEWHLGDALNIVGGIRYTKESKKYHYVRKSLSGDGTPSFPTGLGLDGQNGYFSGDNVDYRLGVNYDFGRDIMAYAQFSTGFKGGGTNPRPFFASQLYGFGPERVKSYEVGLKTQLFDRKLRFNTAAFYSDYTDIQLVLLVCPDGSVPCAGPQNVGSAHIKGAEAEFDAQPVPGLSINGSISYLDFEYYAFSAPTGVGFDDRTPYTSKWKWSIGAQYEIPLSDKLTLTPRIDGDYQSSFHTDPVNGPNNLVKGYALWNGRLTLAAPEDKWQIALQVTNLFDKYYYSSYSDNVAFNGLIFGTPGRPREWAVTVKKSF